MKMINNSLKPVERKFFTVYPRILVTISNSKSPLYETEIQRKIGITYSHMVKSINEMVEWKLLVKTKKGRVTFVGLTDTGVKLAILFKKSFAIMKTLEHKKGER